MEKLFADKFLRSVKKAWGHDFTDTKQALLACLRFQHLNDDASELQSAV